MKISIKKNELLSYTIDQLNNIFPINKINKKNILSSFNIALERTEKCFDHIDLKLKYYMKKDKVFFNHLNSDQYCTYLYFLSNTLYNDGANKNIYEKIYYLNKMLNGLDVLYDVKMPDIFLAVHPVGTVLGKGKYSDYFTFYQSCTVGSHGDWVNKKIFYPTLGKYLTMRPGSSVLGKSVIKDFCQISINSTLMDKNLPKNTNYFGSPKNFWVNKNSKKNYYWF